MRTVVSPSPLQIFSRRGRWWAMGDVVRCFCDIPYIYIFFAVCVTDSCATPRTTNQTPCVGKELNCVYYIIRSEQRLERWNRLKKKKKLEPRTTLPQKFKLLYSGKGRGSVIMIFFLPKRGSERIYTCIHPIDACKISDHTPPAPGKGASVLAIPPHLRLSS